MYFRYTIEHLEGGKPTQATQEFRYFLILEGNGMCIAGHQQYDLQLHDVLALPQNTELLMIADQTEEPAAALPQNTERLLQPDVSITAGCIRVFDMLTPRINSYHLPGAYTDLLRKLFYMALDIQGVDQPYYDSVRDSMDQLVFSALIAAELATNQLNSVVVHVIQQINNSFTDPDFDLRHAIDQTGYSINHFRKLFREEAGIPPLEFLNNRRLDYAKELMRRWKGRLSIAEIAHQCGFQDEYYFSRYFKKHEGMTPVQYVSEYVKLN